MGDDPTRSEKEVAATAFAAAGGAVLLVGVLRRSAALSLLGLAAAALGGIALGRERLAERSEKIRDATEHVRDELAGLDPVARAQVLKDIAQHDVI